MMIYCGCRPGEFFGLNKSDVHLNERYFKIKRGKNKNAIRNVPIHEKMIPFYENWLNKNDSEGFITQINGKKIELSSNHNQFTQTYWDPVLADMDILEYTNEDGEIKKHLPDDTRHTFTTRWKEQHLDEAIRRKIQGHSGKGIGEIVYTYFEFKCVLDELNKLK